MTSIATVDIEPGVAHDALVVNAWVDDERRHAPDGAREPGEVTMQANTMKKSFALAATLLVAATLGLGAAAAVHADGAPTHASAGAPFKWKN